MALVYGVGINDVRGVTDELGNPIRSYTAWRHMLCRAYSESYKLRHPTYVGVSVCPEWHSFSNFKRWYDSNYVDGFQLDKDILFTENKTYSPETCIFVPQWLNKLVTDRKNHRGECLVGVIRRVSGNYIGYEAKINRGRGRSEYIGIFKSEYDAHCAYCDAKKGYIESLRENIESVKTGLTDTIKLRYNPSYSN